MKIKLTRILVLLAAIAIPLSYNACAARYSATDRLSILSTTTGNPIVQFLSVPYTKPSPTFKLTLCINRIDGDGASMDPILWSGGPMLIEVTPEGVQFPNGDLPDLELLAITLFTVPQCDTPTRPASNAQITNDQGTFIAYSWDGPFIRFFGRVRPVSGQVLHLDFTNLLDDLAAVNSDASAFEVLNLVRGTFN